MKNKKLRAAKHAQQIATVLFIFCLLGEFNFLYCGWNGFPVKDTPPFFLVPVTFFTIMFWVYSMYLIPNAWIYLPVMTMFSCVGAVLQAYEIPLSKMYYCCDACICMCCYCSLYLKDMNLWEEYKDYTENL